MTVNTYREKIVAALETYFGGKADTSDSGLAETYMKMSYIKEQVETNQGDPEQLYKKHFFWGTQYDEISFLELVDLITKFSVVQFLAFIIPSYVCDILRVDDQTKHKAASERMKEIIETHNKIATGSTAVQNTCLADAIQNYPLDNWTVGEEANIAADALQERYPGLKQQMLEAKFYYQNIIDKVPKKERNVYRKIKKVDPLDLYCVLAFDKNKNDTALENGLLFKMLLERRYAGSHSEHICILNCNPAFITVLLNSRFFDDCYMTVVMRDKQAQEFVQLSDRLNKPKWTITCERAFRNQKSKKGTPITTLVISTYDKQTKLKEWIENYHPEFSPEGNVIFLHSSTEIEKTSAAFDINETSFTLNDAIILPQKVQGTVLPKRKTIASYSFGDEHTFVKSENVLVRQCELSVLKNRVGLRESHFIGEIKAKDEFERQITLRQLYRNAEYLYNRAYFTTSKNRRAVFVFSRELTITYHYTKLKNRTIGRDNKEDVYQASAKFVLPQKVNKEYKITSESENVGKVIQSTSKKNTSWKNKNKEHAIHWIKNIYPYEKIVTPVTKSTRYVREEVANEFQPILKNRKISLKTLWYIYPLKRTITEKDDSILREMMNIDDIGVLSTEIFESKEEKEIEAIIERIEEHFKHDEKNNDLRLRLLSQLLDIGVKNGHCNQNPLSDLVDPDAPASRDRMKEVKNFFLNRSLTFDEAEKFMKYVKKDTLVNPMALGAAIRLTTGLPSNTICALVQEDINQLQGYPCWRIEINKQVTNDGKDVVQIENPRSRRWFPFPNILLEDLKIIYQNSKSNCPEGLPESSIPVLFKPDSPETNYRIAPKALEAYCKEVLKRIGRSKRVYEIPAADQGTQELNFIRYKGDFFRSNFIQHAVYYAGIEEGDLDYLLGRQGWDTISEHYVGFYNAAVQYNIHEILDRWQSRLLHSGNNQPFSTRRTCFLDTNHVIQGEKSLSPNSYHITLSIPRVNSQVNVKITSEHGALIRVREVK